MFRSIVVGCDGSPGSLAALELACRLRDRSAGRLILTSVRPAEPPGADWSTFADRIEQTSRDILEISARRVPAGVPHETVSEAHPSVAGGLNDVAEREEADLLVLGPSHHHSLSRLAGRMTVQRLLHGAPCSVAVARDDAPGRRVVVAYDGSTEAREALRHAYAVAEGTGADVELVNAIEPITYMGAYAAVVDPEIERATVKRAEHALAEAADQAPDGVEVVTRVAWGSPAEALLADQAGVALVVAGSRGYGTLHRAIAGSVSGTLLTRSEAPVLITPRVPAAVPA